jgi:hypothetical protein
MLEFFGIDSGDSSSSRLELFCSSVVNRSCYIGSIKHSKPHPYEPQNSTKLASTQRAFDYALVCKASLRIRSTTICNLPR